MQDYYLSMGSNSSNRTREPLEPQRDVGRQRVVGRLQAAAALFQERGLKAVTTAEKADGPFNNYGHSE